MESFNANLQGGKKLVKSLEKQSVWLGLGLGLGLGSGREAVGEVRTPHTPTARSGPRLPPPTAAYRRLPPPAAACRRLPPPPAAAAARRPPAARRA